VHERVARGGADEKTVKLHTYISFCVLSLSLDGGAAVEEEANG